MEIQDLSYENLYRKPIIPPERPSALLEQEANESQEQGIFRSVEDIIEISQAPEDTPDSYADSSALLYDFSPDKSEFEGQTIADLRENFSAKSAELSNRLQQFYSAQGIRPPVAADMTIDAEGRIIVAGNIDQKSALESEFANDPALSASFEELTSIAPVLRAADVSENFAGSFDRQPDSAIAENPGLFSDAFKFNFHYEYAKLSGEFKSEVGTTIEWWRET